MDASSADRQPNSDADSVSRMRQHWRQFAREDPMYYVATDRIDWTPADFYSVGRGFAEDVLEWAGSGLRRERMVELGCGAGRMLVHFAPEFEHVDGIDIAPEMLEAARRHGLPENVNLIVGSGNDLRPIADASADFVLSREVFQHIPDREVISSYVREIARILRRGGRGVLHFDTRRSTLRRRLGLLLPDRLLPRPRRRYIRRYPLPEDWPTTAADAAGLEVIDERFPASEQHLVLVERRV